MCVYVWGFGFLFFFIICTCDFFFLNIINTSWLGYEIKPEVAIQSRMYEEKPNLTGFLHPPFLLRVVFWKNSRILHCGPLGGHRQEVSDQELEVAL